MLISICSHSSNAPIFDHKTIRFFSQCQHVVQNRRRFSFLSRPNLCHLIRLTSDVYFTYYIPETCCRSNKTEKPDSIVSVEFLHRFVYRNSKSRLPNRLPVFIYLHHETLIQAFSFNRSTRFFFSITINSFFLYDHGSATTVYIIITSSRLSQRCNERTRRGKSSIVESWIG